MSSNVKILLTGSTGFIGGFVRSRLKEDPRFSLTVAVRKTEIVNASVHAVGDISAGTDWSAPLSGVDVVVHCAALAHLKGNGFNTLEKFRQSNTDATLSLATQAAAQGVRRFIFLSSIGVNGNTSSQPFSAEDAPAPAEPYAISKLEAELGLIKIQSQTAMEVVIIRPPLVYGPNPPGNFGLLMNLVATGLPLPLGGIKNRRSFVSVWNLVDLVVTCIDHPAAAGQVFLVRDGEDVSTSGLIEDIASAQGRSLRLFWLPQTLFKIGSMLVRKRQIYQRLFDSLEVDDTPTRQRLNWEPPCGLKDSLRKCFR